MTTAYTCAGRLASSSSQSWNSPALWAHGGLAQHFSGRSRDPISSPSSIGRTIGRPWAMESSASRRPRRDALAAQCRLNEHHVVVEHLAALRRLIAHPEGLAENFPRSPSCDRTSKDAAGSPRAGRRHRAWPAVFRYCGAQTGQISLSNRRTASTAGHSPLP